MTEIKTPELLDNWLAILQKAWSVKFNIAAALFAAAEVIVVLMQPEGMPNGVFAGIAAALSVGSNIVRVLAQNEISNGKH
jgi:hypothetical protein